MKRSDEKMVVGRGGVVFDECVEEGSKYYYAKQAEDGPAKWKKATAMIRKPSTAMMFRR